MANLRIFHLVASMYLIQKTQPVVEFHSAVSQEQLDKEPVDLIQLDSVAALLDMESLQHSQEVEARYHKLDTQVGILKFVVVEHETYFDALARKKKTRILFLYDCITAQSTSFY